MPIVKIEDWLETAKIHFGEDPKEWRFKCPCCGHIQSIASVLKHYPDLDPKKVREWIYFNCEGRQELPEKEGKNWKPKIGCDYTLGGLFVMNDLLVLREEGLREMVFNFADEKADKDIRSKDFIVELNKQLSGLKSKCEKTATWEKFEWDKWVPEEVRKELSEFHKTPLEWFTDINQEEIMHGDIVTMTVKRGGENEKHRGRYIHAWNNVGRLCKEDGTYIVL